jgi:hypothetical protein
MTCVSSLGGPRVTAHQGQNGLQKPFSRCSRSVQPLLTRRKSHPDENFHIFSDALMDELPGVVCDIHLEPQMPINRQDDRVYAMQSKGPSYGESNRAG